MNNMELANEIRTIIKYLCDVGGRQDKYALECCDELDRKMTILDMFQNSLTVEYHNEIPPIDVKHRDDGGVDVIFKNTIIEFIRNRIDKEAKEKLTQWVIENIDKEVIRKWLDESKN